MFFEAMDLYRTLDLKSNPRDSFHFEYNFQRIKIFQQLGLIRMSTQRAYWCYHCSVTYITQQWRSCHENFSFIVT